MNLNRVTIAGNLTRDVDLKYTQSGAAIASFGIAVNRKWKDVNGSPKEDVTFLDITAFGKQAELLAQYLKKGNPLYLEGRLKLDQWDDKTTGQKRSKLGVVLESFQFIGKGEKQEPRPKIEKSDFPPPLGGKPEPDDTDIPF